MNGRINTRGYDGGTKSDPSSSIGQRSSSRIGRIRRILYSFGISRVLTVIRRFVPFKEKSPLERILEGFSTLFPKKAPPTPKEKVTTPAAAPVAAAPVSPKVGVNIWLLLVIILIFGVIVFLPLLTVGKAPEEIVVTEGAIAKPSIKVSIVDSGILDSGKSQRFFGVTNISGQFDNVSAIFTVYRDPNPTEIFILRTTRLRASYYKDFISQFKSELAKDGMTATDITMDELLRLPENSHIVLIVPTGYMPELFVEGPLDMKTFAERGNVMVFIGYPPTEGVIKKGSTVPQPVSADDVTKKFSLSFEHYAEKPERLNFTTSLYTVRAKPTEKIQPIIYSRPGEAVVQWKGQGYVYFIATTIDDWWMSAGNISGRQLATLVTEAWWNTRYAGGSAIIEKKNSTENNTTGNILSVIFTDPLSERTYGINEAYGRLKLTATRSEKNASSTIGKIVDFAITQRPKGRMQHEEEFISSLLTDKNMEIIYSLNESSELKHINLTILNTSYEYALAPTLMYPEPVTLKVPQSSYLFFNNLPSGSYILRIIDEDGRLLAQSYLKVPSFRIESYSAGWMVGEFVFKIYYENSTDVYRERLKHIKISLDGKDEKEVEAIGGAISYNVSYSPSPGPHTFTFKIGSDTVKFELPYVKVKEFWEKPEYIAMGLIALFLFGIAFLIRPREEVFYAIDVPDFPPLHSIAIPVKRETVLQMFDNINKELRWQFTPLTLQDLKTGFAKLSFRGRAIMIGDYNLELLLDQLIREGTVKAALDYYGPAVWEVQSGKSIYLLAMQRALRDVFVVEGIPFTPFDESPQYDTSVYMLGEKVFIHIYQDESVIEKALATSVEGRTLIVFENEDILRDFTRRIHSSSCVNVAFKMHLDNPNGNIILTPLKNIIDVLNKRYVPFYY